MMSRILWSMLALLCALLPVPLSAAPIQQATEPTLQVSAETVAPGGSIHVAASGIAVTEQTTLCLGILGPGQNVEEGLSPSFRLRLGQITVAADGTGNATVTIPTNLVPGSYRVTIGGCPPQADLPPLAALATANLMVTAPGLQTTHFFAEGSTAPPFDTWLLLFNPNPSPITATVTFLGAGVSGSQTMTVAPNSRASLYVNQILPNSNFGMRVDSNLPIAAERAMFFRQDGTAVAGVPAPRTLWLFGEGATAAPHETWFLMANPNDATATATLSFSLEDGRTQNLRVEIPPMSRSTVFANLVLPPSAFATRITSNLPIVAERSMFKSDTGGGGASPGTPNSASAWFFAEGSTSPPFDTWFLLYNPNPNEVRILARLYQDTGGPGPLLDFTMPPNSRRSLFMNQIRPNVSFGATIVSEGGGIIAERSMFFGLGQTGSQGANSLSTNWTFAEGATAPPFQTWILLTNPSGRDSANVTLTFFFPNGTSTTRNVVVGGEGRASLFLNQFLPETAVATRIQSDLPIVAERSMYFSGGNGGTNAFGFPE